MALNTLLVDTTLVGFALGLAEVEGSRVSLKWQKCFCERYGAAQYLVSALQDGLASCGIEAAEIDLVVVGKGPGSFTGIKIGLSFAAGLYAGNTNIDFCGVSSLAMLGLGIEKSKGLDLQAKTSVAIKATKDHGFCSFAASRFSELSDFTCSSLKLEDADHPCLKSGQIFVVDRWHELESLASNKGLVTTQLEVEETLKLVLSGMVVYLQKSPLATKSPPGPCYMKKSTAEERLEKT